jgi:hypothetical protein
MGITKVRANDGLHYSSTFESVRFTGVDHWVPLWRPFKALPLRERLVKTVRQRSCYPHIS